jgi:hypothetical protein
VNTSTSGCMQNSVEDGFLSHGGHLKPLTIDAFSRIISSLFDRFLVEVGSASLWICEKGAVAGE